jgi:hypothetical protein
VGGALIGAFLTVVLLLFAGPRPAPLPAQPRVGHVTIAVDDAYLTSAVRQAANSVPVASGFTGITAHAQPGDRILISGTAQSLFLQVPVSMTLQPLARDGKLTMHVLSASVGGAPVPAVVTGQLERSINAQLGSLGQSALSGTPQYVVTGVATSLGHLILTLGPAS